MLNEKIMPRGGFMYITCKCTYKQRFGSVIFFYGSGSGSDPKTKTDPDPDPDPGKSTSNCVKRIRNTKRKNVRILPLEHNQISAVICRPISIFLNISKSQ